jgi:triosephosphate isomerase
MRKNIVAGNWKMNKNVIDAQQLMAQLLEYKKANAPIAKFGLLLLHYI